jgi:hypothetical protein
MTTTSPSVTTVAGGTRIATSGTIRWIKVGDILVNPSAQRELRPGWAHTIAANFDPAKFGIPVLSRRGDHFYVVDGQHRIEALRIMGRQGNIVQCEVRENLDEQDEAAMFLGRNASKTVRAVDKFRVGVVAGLPAEAEINRITNECGLTVGSSGHSDLRCTTTLMRLHRFSPETLRRTLTIANKVYGTPGLAAHFLDGLGMFVHRFPDVADADVIAALTHRGGFTVLLSQAEMNKNKYGKPMPVAIGFTIHEIVNARRRGASKLPSWWA